jgi:hypothetical protein
VKKMLAARSPTRDHRILRWLGFLVPLVLLLNVFLASLAWLLVSIATR